MVKKVSKPIEKLPSPNLLISRDQARTKIQERIDLGLLIRNSNITNQQELDKATLERSKWSNYNCELLKRIFDNSLIADEYNAFFGGIILFDAPLSSYVRSFHEGIDDKINRLETISEKLELIPEPISTGESNLASSPFNSSLNQDVFLVHGHDNGLKESVARFIERLDINVIILHEQVNAGKTIIEKFESHSIVGFAVILLTPDDIGGPKNNNQDRKLRARQNVILEFGFFLAKLGRNRVCALYCEGVELPSDLHGILYIQVDTNGFWKLALAREMKQAGLPIDLNKIN